MKDIWHFPEEAPAYCFLCVFEDIFDHEYHCGHYNPVKKQFCYTEGKYEIYQVKTYCDLLHLLDCETRLNKLLEISQKYLRNIAYLNMSEHGIGSDNMMIDWCKSVAHHALKEIKTITEG